ncbi:protein CutA-like [Coturnix japonica]|uniref:protein CutA-like n=1 Tax=Coturnix japonica TaxID=93934 RepID=UPI000777C998|nr:protein CutA-like [Coturnix japonica]
MRAALGALAVLLLLRSPCRRLTAMAAPEGASYQHGNVSAAFVTCPNEDVAKRMARAMVEQKLAACVNIVPKVTSM